MTTINKKLHLPVQGADGAADVQDVMAEIANDAAADTGTGGVDGSQFPAISPTATPETSLAGRMKAAASGGTMRASLDAKLDPIKGTPAEKILDLLKGDAFGPNATPDETNGALDQLKQQASAMTPDQDLALMRSIGLQPGSSLNDPKTKDAIKQIQEAAGLPMTGQLDLETLLALVEAAENKRNAQRAGSQPMARPGTAGSGGSSGATSGPASYVPRRQGTAESGAPATASAPGTAPTGTLKTNQQEAYKAALQEGLSPTAAKALVANMTGESLSNPADNHWDVSHMSQGIVQWDPGRAAAIKAQFGKEPKDMTVAEQTKAAIWEMKTKYPSTYAALKNGTDPNAMISSLVRDYERPANPAGEIAKRMGNYNQLGYLDSANA